MNLRSSRVFKREKPKIKSNVKNEGFSNEKRLSLRSNKSNYGKMGESEARSYQNVEMGMKKTLKCDDNVYILGLEAVRPIKDFVFSSPKKEIVEEEIESSHVDCENGSKSLESETCVNDLTIVNGDDATLNDLLVKCKERKEKGKRGRKKKNVGNLKKTESKHEKSNVGVNGDGECTVMPLKDKRGRKRKNVEASGCECSVRVKKDEIEKDDVRVTRSVLRSRNLSADSDGFEAVVLGLKRLDKIPKKMLKRRGRPPKVLTEGSDTRPKKKLKRKPQSEITPLPLNEKLKRRGRGRPPKVSHKGIQQKVYGKGVTFKKFKRRGRPPKLEARTLATHVIKMKLKSPKICKKSIGGKSSRMQLIRDKLSKVLSECGWTVDRRQRQEKTYKDAVYIEPNGKRSHWSITGAYATLKRKIESGYADENERSGYTPIPEEEISILFRQRRKELKTKKKKTLKNVKKGKIVTDKKRKHGKKSKDGSKKKIIFKPRILVRESENGVKEDNEGGLVNKKRNLLSWMIDSGVILAGTKVQYGKTRRQKRSCEGVVTGDGICCGCCDEVMGITKFVSHCGGKFDFDNVYLESGTCLRKCLMDSWKKEEESNINRFNVVDVQGDDPNDDTCNVCGDGGNLICCDACPSTFHQSCLDVQSFPSGDWNCIYCTCKFCGVVSVSTPQDEDTHDVITSPMLSCCLCEEKFHQLCLQEGEDVNKDSSTLPFCGMKCQELFERLQTCLGVKHELEEGFSWTLLRRADVDQDFNLHATKLTVEHNSKLAIAFSVMDECFVPIVDQRSGASIIRNVVYNCGSNFRRLNYAGFLTAVLEKDDEFITAASIRIHGYRLAEMPFIGTRHMYRRQGMCRRLLDAIESTLSSLGVEELIIPAIPALLQTWTNAFGFMPLEESKKQAMRCMSMMVFPGIDMLKKPLLLNPSAHADHTLSSGAVGVRKDVTDDEEKEETILLTDDCSSREPNDENNPQCVTTSSNATDCKPTSADTDAVLKDVIIDYKQTEKETVFMDCCSSLDLEDEKLNISNGVNSLCDLNLPVKDVVPCDTDGQTSVDSESFHDCTIEPSSLESVDCGNLESSELKFVAENDGVSGVVKVNSPPLTSKLVLKNTFDLNLHPIAVETDVHIINSFDLSDSRSQVDQIAGGQTDSKTCESQPLVMH